MAKVSESEGEMEDHASDVNTSTFLGTTSKWEDVNLQYSVLLTECLAIFCY